MIEISHLVKKYGSHTAVDDLSLTVEPGRIYGFLGPNGAGKSTTMNIVTGYLGATSGEVKINGYDILKQPEEAKKCIGYLPEVPPLWAGARARAWPAAIPPVGTASGCMATPEIHTANTTMVMHKIMAAITTAAAEPSLRGRGFLFRGRRSSAIALRLSSRPCVRRELVLSLIISLTLSGSIS